MEPRQGGARLVDVLAMGFHPRFLLSLPLWRTVSRLHGQYTAEGMAKGLGNAGFADVRVEPTLQGLGLLATATKV
jgi:hypothetical protein